MASSEREGEFEEQLKDAGNRLFTPPSSVDELLNLLDKVEHLLANVEQAPSKSMQDALLPSMKALISTDLLRHSDVDVRVSVASCVNEITRITAPEAPYNDEQMKEIFNLTVAAFEKLSHVSSRCYTKAVSILDTVAKVRSFMVMLDLECDALIIQMFQHFLKIIRSNHPHSVFSDMETIMTLVIDESEDVSLDLLSPLLASVRKENQSISPMSWKLAEKVLANCACKLRPYLMEVIQSIGLTLDEYSPVVASICKNEFNTLDHHNVIDSAQHLGTKELSSDAVCPEEVCQAVDDNSKLVMSNGTAPSDHDDSLKNASSSKALERCSLIEHSKSTDTGDGVGPDYSASGKAVKSEIDAETVPKKRGRKPNSLMNPEEGYDHSWICTGKKTPKIHPGKKPLEKGVDCSPSENPVSKKAHLQLTRSKVSPPPGISAKISEAIGVSSPSAGTSVPGKPKRGRPRKKNIVDQDADPNLLLVSKGEALNAQSEKKAPQSADVTVKIEPRDKSDPAMKRRKRLRKERHATKAAQETTQMSGYVVSEKEEEAPSDSDNMEQQSVKVESAGEKRSSIHSDTKKRRLNDGTPNKVSTEASGNKKVIFKTATKSSREGSQVEETPKTSHKRKHAVREDVASEMSDLGEELVGRRIKVWWPLDKTFYEGVVDSYDHVKKKHRVLYADGDEEVLNLKKQRWELIGDAGLPEKEEEIDGPKPATSSDLLQTPKRKKNKESTKKAKGDSFSRRNGGSTRKYRTKGRKSAKPAEGASDDGGSTRKYRTKGRKSAKSAEGASDDGGSIRKYITKAGKPVKSSEGASDDNPIGKEEPMKHVSRRDDSSKSGQKSTGMSETGTSGDGYESARKLKTVEVDSKENAAATTATSKGESPRCSSDSHDVA